MRWLRAGAGGGGVLDVAAKRRPLSRAWIALVVGAAIATGSFVAGALEWLEVHGALVAAESEHRALGTRHETLRERLAQLDRNSRQEGGGAPATDVAAHDRVHDEILERADMPDAGAIARRREKF